MLKIVLIGLPGCGKGTQARMMSERYEAPAISAGDLFRNAGKYDYGEEARKYIKKGDLIPDWITVGMLKERLADTDCTTRFILDGFPRTLNQAQELNDVADINVVIELRIDDNTALERLLSKLRCKKCGAIYGGEINPKEKGKCDKCGGELIKKADDKEEAIKERLYVYHRYTEVLLDYYKPREIVFTVDGSKKPEEVFTAICEIIDGL